MTTETNCRCLVLVANANSPHVKKVVECLRNEYKMICIFSIHPSCDSGVWEAELFQNNVSVSVLPVANLRIPLLLRYIIGALWLRFKLSQLKIKESIVNAHYASGYGLMALLACWPNPYLVSVYGSDITEFPNRSLFHKLLIRVILSSAAKILVTSRFLSLEVARLLPNASIDFKVVQTPFCVEEKYFEIGRRRILLDSSCELITFGFAKELKEIYNVSLLLHSYSRLVHQCKSIDKFSGMQPRYRLLIAGGGEMLNHYKGLAARLGLSDSVKFLGRLSPQQMPNFYESIDVYMAISSRESFGVSALEASASAVPVISSGVQGLSEVVLDRVTGVVLKDLSVESIMISMLQLSIDPKFRRSCGCNAHEYARQHYPLSVMKSAFLAALD